MKIKNDKYYTPIDTANHCIDLVIECIGIENITDVILPSVGNGSFLHHDKLIPNIAYDIIPEVDSSNHTIVKQCDFLKEDIQYKKGRLIIGNPPFGEKMHLAQLFYHKAVEICDYIAFILPISQLNNNSSLFEFNLVKSYDIGTQQYSGVELNCCFNIYKRPENGICNKPNKSKSSCIKIIRQDSKNYNSMPFDIRMCYWGNGSCGKILTEDEHYSAEYKIQIIDKEHYREIYDFITSFDWKNYRECIAMKKLQQYHIIKALDDNLHFNSKNNIQQNSLF